MPNTKEKGKLIEVLSKHIPYGYATLCLIADELMDEGVRLEEKRATSDGCITKAVREKLVELLADSVYENVELDDGYVGYEVNNEQIADYLIAHGVTVQEWISVKDRLPALHTDDYEEPDGSRMQFDVSDNQWVITTSGYQTKAWYETGPVFQGWVGEYGETIRNVTHWMPLPQPPKGE